jgi:hypothetical protein
MDAHSPAEPPESAPQPPPEDGAGRLRSAGRTAWAVLGLVGLLVVVGFLLSRLTIIWAPAVIALFPAALLTPAAKALKRRGVPPAGQTGGGLGMVPAKRFALQIAEPTLLSRSSLHQRVVKLGQLLNQQRDRHILKQRAGDDRTHPVGRPETRPDRLWNA